MKFSTKLLTTFAVAGLALSPTRAHADPVPCATYQLGIGGYLNGCWGGLSVSRWYEFAGDVSNMYWFTNTATAATFPGTGAPFNGGANAPNTSLGASLLFNDDCNSNGDPSAPPGKFCAPNGGAQTQTVTWNNAAELVFGLHDLGTNTWMYSGPFQSRNTPPTPGALQEVLMLVTGYPDANTHFLLGWEDRNTGCFSKLGVDNISWTQVNDANYLATVLNACNAANGNGTSDSDYNDFYVLIDAPVLGRPQDVVPEPVTMTLLATGLVGLGGASLRKRNKKS